MWRSLPKDLFKRFNEDDLLSYAATITYFFILSLFPFLIFLITLLARTAIFDANHYFNLMDSINKLEGIAPPEVLQVLQQGLKEVNTSKSNTFLSLSLFFTVYSASGGVQIIMKVMNRAYKIQESRCFFKVLFLSFIYTVGFALLILVAFIFSLLTSQLGVQLFNYLGLASFYKVWSFIINIVLPIFIMTVLFMFIYRFTPDRKLRFSQVWGGSLFATLASLIASRLFSYYVSHFFNYSVVYGSIGSIIVFLVWLYLLSFILIFGGELNASLECYFKNRG